MEGGGGTHSGIGGQPTVGGLSLTAVDWSTDGGWRPSDCDLWPTDGGRRLTDKTAAGNCQRLALN